MSAFDNMKQKMVTLVGVRMETGRVTATVGDNSDQTFDVASKLKKVLFGFGVIETDGQVAYPAVGNVSNGQVSWTRIGPITTEADTLQYILFGN